MNRDPLVTLPPALAPRSRRHARARRARAIVLGIDGGATKTLAAVLDLDRRVLHLGHGGPEQRGRGRRAAARSKRCSTPPTRRSRGPVSPPSELAAAVLAVAGTDTDAIDRARARRTQRGLDRRQRRRRRVGHRHRRAARRRRDLRHRLQRLRRRRPGRARVARRRLGAPARRRGLRLLAGRAVDQGRALRDRDGSGPPTALSDAALAFFGAPTVEALAAQRLHQAADQGRDRGLRDRDRAAWPARATRSRASCTRAPRRAGPRRSPRSSARPASTARSPSG